MIRPGADRGLNLFLTHNDKSMMQAKKEMGNFKKEKNDETPSAASVFAEKKTIGKARGSITSNHIECHIKAPLRVFISMNVSNYISNFEMSQKSLLGCQFFEGELRPPV